MNLRIRIVCTLGMVCQLGSVMALPPCPETGYFHNCFGTRTYAPKVDSEWSRKVIEAWKALEREIEQTKKELSGTEDIQTSPPTPQVLDKPNTLASPVPTYVGEFKDDKRDGYGVYVEGESRYEGSWKNDVKSGKGFFKPFRYYMVFVGEFTDGKRLGLGQLLLTNDDVYVGQFRDGLTMAARVTSRQDISGREIMEWVDSGISGEGVLYYADGSMGIGEWRGGLPHGLFIEYDPNRSVRSSGIYINGKLHESRNVRLDEFHHIQVLPLCNWKEAKNQCVATVVSSNEAEDETYEGDFQDGKYDGRGKYFHATKGTSAVVKLYRGEFKNNQFHGVGTLRFDDGRVQIGEWLEGKQVRLFIDSALNKTVSEPQPTSLEAR